MEYRSSSLVHTSLDLNSFPYYLPNQELQTTFNGYEARIIPPAKPEEVGELTRELTRVNLENQNLMKMVKEMYKNYNLLQNRLSDYMIKNPPQLAKKHKSDTTINENSNISNSSNETTCKNPTNIQPTRPKISKVFVRVKASDTSLVVNDGYKWRKYGQKVTRDNPYPRAYFKCSYAPTCPVKKKVQRNIYDQTIVVATYEGEHNHQHPSRHDEVVMSPCLNHIMINESPRLAIPTVTLDLTTPIKSGSHSETQMALQQFLVDQMTSSLTKDPSFKAAVASAISGQVAESSIITIN